MSRGDFIELSSPYGLPGHYGGGSDAAYFGPGPSNTIKRKPISATYNPIQEMQEEEDAKMAYIHSNQPLLPVQLKPGTIGKVGLDLIAEVLVCSFAVLIAIPFIWLAVAMARFHRVGVTDENTNYIQQSTRTVSTFFTILFAAVVGSTLKRFANLRLERGVRLGLLEQVMQSRTFFAALTTQITLRSMNLMAVVLMIVWMFSPLGSQASLRLISTGIISSYDEQLVSYVDTVTNNGFTSASGVSSLITSLKPLYNAAMLGPPSLRASSMDLWGNVKIPFFDDQVQADKDGWIDLTKVNMTEESYTALVGVPVNGLDTRNATFIIETTYMKLDCDAPVSQPLLDINYNISLIKNGSFYSPNVTTEDCRLSICPDWRIAINQFVGNTPLGHPELIANNSDNNLPPSTFLFQTRGPWVVQCGILQEYIQSNVSCVYTALSLVPTCSVIAQRRSLNKHAPSTVTALNFYGTFSSAGRTWIRATDNLSSSGYSSLTEYYLQNTSSGFILSGNGRNYADYSNVTAFTFSIRMTQLLNTWFLGSQISADMLFDGIIHQKVTAQYRQVHAVYLCELAWLAAYCASIAVMFFAGLFTIWCAMNTTGPDVLGYCSSFTRDSRYFNAICGGSTLHGLDRTEMLKDLQVRLGEVVDPDWDVRRPKTSFNNYEPIRETMRTISVAPIQNVRTPNKGQLYV